MKRRTKIFVDMKSRTIRQMVFRDYLISAITENVKDETRLLVLPENSRIAGLPPDAGLDGVELESGRGTAAGEIRARRTFDNGQVRVVTIQSIVRPHDLFWVTTPDMKRRHIVARRKSRLTLEVISVRGIRVQDMTNADALREGVSYVPETLLRKTAADLQGRNVFAILWDDRS